MSSRKPSEPWHAFLTDLDAGLQEKTRLECLGGFVVTLSYGLPRPTGDIDVLSVVPSEQLQPVLNLAGRDSRLHRKHGVYLQHVGVVTLPENCEERLVEMFSSCYRQLELFGLDPYDLALSKLARNIQRDRDDVKYLARTVPLDLHILKQRYQEELRPYFSSAEQDDLTIELWLRMIGEESTPGENSNLRIE